MKIDMFKMTQEELDIMENLWSSNRVLTTAQLSHSLSESCNKKVKPSTVNRLCRSLTQKGFITHVQISGCNLYIPLMQKDEYQFVMAKLLIAKLFDGSIENMISVLLRDMDMSKDTLSTLQSMLASARLPSEEFAEKQPEQSMTAYDKTAAFSKIPNAIFFYIPKTHIHKKRLCKAHRPRAS